MTTARELVRSTAPNSAADCVKTSRNGDFHRMDTVEGLRRSRRYQARVRSKIRMKSVDTAGIDSSNVVSCQNGTETRSGDRLHKIRDTNDRDRALEIVGKS
jgi:hypothetical protein